MAYKQNFGLSRESSKDKQKDSINKIMSGEGFMQGYNYAVPADKLQNIQDSEGLSRKSSPLNQDYSDKRPSSTIKSKDVSYEDGDNSSSSSSNTGVGYNEKWNKMSDDAKSKFKDFSDFQTQAEAWNKANSGSSNNTSSKKVETSSQTNVGGPSEKDVMEQGELNVKNTMSAANAAREELGNIASADSIKAHHNYANKLMEGGNFTGYMNAMEGKGAEGVEGSRQGGAAAYVQRVGSGGYTPKEALNMYQAGQNSEIPENSGGSDLVDNEAFQSLGNTLFPREGSPRDERLSHMLNTRHLGSSKNNALPYMRVKGLEKKGGQQIANIGNLLNRFLQGNKDN